MRKTLVTTTAPTQLPVSIERVKDRTRIDGDEEVALLDLWIETATMEAQSFLNRRLMPQTVELRMDCFPEWGTSLVADPIRSVASVVYDDSSNVEQTLATSVYETDLDRLRGWIQPASGQSWPSTYDKLQAVRISMEVGFADAESIPEPIRDAIAMLAAHYFEHRVSDSMPKSVHAMLWPYRVVPV